MAVDPISDALVLVDVQVDFCPGGSLAVPRGDEVVPVLNRYVQRFQAAGALVVATRDWHPPRTKHFEAYGGPWPPHCVQGTPGAAFHPELWLPPGVRVFSKGMDPEEDAYSGFQARDERGVGLGAALRERGVQRLFVGGLATDYCVRATVLDALREGFQAVVLLDAVRAVDVKPGDGERALEEVRAAGARCLTLEEL